MKQRVVPSHVEPATQEIYIPDAGFICFTRGFLGAQLYDSNGAGFGEIDFDGSENTFVLDAGTDFEFFGYSYDPLYSDDSEVVVLQGAVDAGDERVIHLGEAGNVEDWDVVSFDGLAHGVSLDLSQANESNGDDVTVTVGTDTGTGAIMGDIVAYVDGAEGVFGSGLGDTITGDSGRNIIHGGEGGDVVSGGEGQDLISGGAGSDSVYGGAGEDILIDLEGGDVIYGDDIGVDDPDSRSDDTFIVGNGANGTTIQDFDLSPDGTGLSGRSNQSNDIVFIQVTAASLAGAGYSLSEIYTLVTDSNEGAWRQFVRQLEVEVVAGADPASTNQILLSIQKDGVTTSLGSIEFNEHGTGSGNYNAVKMKDRIEDVLAQFESGGAGQSDNAHVLEQFFGMDSLTAEQMAALERAQVAGEEAEAAGGDTATVSAALIENELTGETFDAAQAVRDAVTSAQVSGTPSDVIAAVEEVIADAVDEAFGCNGYGYIVVCSDCC